jgi:hypothetical protein
MIILLDKTSATYKKRLVKAIREVTSAIYYHRDGTNHRVYGVRFLDNELRVKLFTPTAWEIVPDSAIDNFSDASGRTICASREMKIKR